MEKTRVAVVGLGGIAQIMHLPLLEKFKEVEIAGICDTDNSKAKNIALRYNLEKGYTNVGLMLDENPGIDAVIISAQTDVHKELSVKCLEAGKHVLVEKPIARNAKETRPIVEAAEKYKKLLVVGMNNRFRNDSMLARNFIRGKELGEVFYVKAGWLKMQSSNQKWFMDMEKSGGGVFLDNGIVMLDLGMWMLGFPEIKSISAINYYHNTKAVEDSNFTFVKFKNDSALTIEVSWSMLRGGEFFYCNTFGTEGSSTINPLRINKKINNQLFDITPKNIKTVNAMYKNSYENELRYFIGSIRGTHTPISTGREALMVMEAADAMYKAAKTGKEVTFT